MNTAECPYCGFDNDVNDGECYEATGKHEFDCYKCEKTFVFEVEYDPIFSTSQAEKTETAR